MNAIQIQYLETCAALHKLSCKASALSHSLGKVESIVALKKLHTLAVQYEKRLTAIDIAMFKKMHAKYLKGLREFAKEQRKRNRKNYDANGNPKVSDQVKRIIDMSEDPFERKLPSLKF